MNSPTPTESIPRWFIHLGGSPEGPFIFEEIEKCFRDGRATPETKVWYEGWENWQAASDVEMLASAIAPSSLSAPSDNRQVVWWLVQDDEPVGPFSTLDIDSKISTGEVDNSRWLIRTDWEEWKPITEAEEFRHLLHAGPPAAGVKHAAVSKGATRKLKWIGGSVVGLFVLLWMFSDGEDSEALADKIHKLEVVAERQEEPVIFVAVREHQRDVLAFLLRPGGVNSKGQTALNLSQTEDRYGQTPLHLAAELGDVASMKLLIEAGADTKVADQYGKLVIHSAAEGGFVDTMRLLLAAGEKIDERTVENRNPRDVSNDPMVRSSLSRRGINPVDGSHPIHVAARRGNVAMVKFLLERGASPDSKDNNGQTVLEYARQDGPLVDRGDAERGNRLGVVRLFVTDQPAQAPEEDISHEELQRTFFGR